MNFRAEPGELHGTTGVAGLPLFGKFALARSPRRNRSLMSSETNPEPIEWQALARRHQVWGWRLLALFMAGGLALESMQGFKIGLYLDEPNSLRRELWTLAHAHGTLIAIVQLLFAQVVSHRWWTSWPRMRLCSFLYLWAALLLPGGFFLGGLAPYDNSDPAIGIWLVPLGAMFLIIAALITASQAAASAGNHRDAGGDPKL